MSDYKHGAYGEVGAGVERESVSSPLAPVYGGTAPVHTVKGGADNVNRPVVVKGFEEAVNRFGYSDDWARYTLCEAMWAHFKKVGAGPIVLINTLDVAKCKEETKTQKTVTPVNGAIKIAEARNAVLDSVAIDGKQAGVDFVASYSYETGLLRIRELITGALGTAELTVSYDTVDPAEVKEDDVIGESDGEGRNTGLHAVKNLYPLTAYVPNLLLAPGFSENKAVRDAMERLSRKVNSHFDMVFYTDIPLVGESGRVTLAGAHQWKESNGYTAANEKVFFPMAEDQDGRKYHISTLAAAVRQSLDAESGGRPYRSPSNQPVAIKGAYLGEDMRDLVLDDDIINQNLCRYGITSVAFVGGRQVIWGAHTAAYTPETKDTSNAFDTNLAMMYWITNDFQIRRANEVDKPIGKGRLDQIVAEENARLDALVSIGMLTYGKVKLKVDAAAVADMQMGDYAFVFEVNTTKLANSLTAYLMPTDKGMDTTFGEVAA